MRSPFLVALASLLSWFPLAGDARADLPPPDGQRFVDYAFQVDGLAAAPDHVLLAYPWSTSNGAPTREVAVVADGVPVPVGRRSGETALYAMKRADHDAWLAAHPEAGAPGYQGALLDELFAGAQVARCNLAPSPTFVLGSDDPRDRVVERFRVATLAAGKCELARAEPLPGGSSPAEPPSSSAGAPASSGHPAAAGCAGCAVPGADDVDLGAVAFGLVCAVAPLLRRRRRG